MHSLWIWNLSLQLAQRDANILGNKNILSAIFWKMAATEVKVRNYDGHTESMFNHYISIIKYIFLHPLTVRWCMHHNLGGILCSLIYKGKQYSWKLAKQQNVCAVHDC